MKKGPVVLIYDGECPVCRGAVDWIRARSRPDDIEFLSCHDQSLSERFPFLDKSACLKAAHLVLPDGRVLAGEQAAADLFMRLPGYAWLARVLRFPGVRTLSRVFYHGFARRRHVIAALFSPGHGNT
jgi:predicted DCC family thiol-disulfide oxidoreductase YuxK